MTFPIVHLQGEPFDQGHRHGLALGDQIAHNLEVYYDRFQREAELEPREVRSRAEHLLPVLSTHPYWQAIRGMAEGSGIDLVDLLVLNLRYELMYYQYSILPVGGADGCTSFGVLPSQAADGHLLIGENWDWIPHVAGALLRTREPDGLETLSFTEAGIVAGKIGLNSDGLGLGINGLLTTSDDWSRKAKPFHVRCYEVLRQRSFVRASDVISSRPRACSANFVLAQSPVELVDIEAAPEATAEISPEDGVVAHTNHFLDPAHLGIEEPHSERRPHTYSRLVRMRELLEARAPVSVGDLQTILSDHDNFPDSICRHEHPDDPPQEACTTVTSVIMDLDERALWLTDGNPCEHQYERYAL